MKRQAHCVSFYGIETLTRSDALLARAQALGAEFGVQAASIRNGVRALRATPEKVAEAVAQDRHVELGHFTPTDKPYATLMTMWSFKKDIALIYVDAALSESLSSFCDAVERVFRAEIIHTSGGYAYQRAYEQGPEGYALGLLVNPRRGDDPRDEQNVSRWGTAKRFGTLKRYLRDVYPINYLSAAQLDAEVAGARLRDYIESPQHGRCLPVATNFVRWDVDESALATARRDLSAAGLLVADHLHGTASQRPVP